MVGGGGYSRKWEKGEGDWVLGTARPVSVVFLSIKEEKTLPAWLLNKSTFSHWLCTTDTTFIKANKSVQELSPCTNTHCTTFIIQGDFPA